jgi:hypothetical protein
MRGLAATVPEHPPRRLILTNPSSIRSRGPRNRATGDAATRKAYHSFPYADRSRRFGDLPSEPDEEPAIVRREDGSWLIDGSLDLDTAARALDAPDLLDEEDGQHVHTVGGLAMFALGQIPRTGDVFRRGDYRFEVVDMDGNRVDRVLVSHGKSGPEGPPSST